MKTITKSGPVEIITGCPHLEKLGIEKIEITYGMIPVKIEDQGDAGQPWSVSASALVKVNNEPWNLPVIAEGAIAFPYRVTDVFQFESLTDTGVHVPAGLHPKTCGILRGWILAAAEADFTLDDAAAESAA